jgi:hypothetical protein
MISTIFVPLPARALRRLVAGVYTFRVRRCSALIRPCKLEALSMARRSRGTRARTRGEQIMIVVGLLVALSMVIGTLASFFR